MSGQRTFPAEVWRLDAEWYERPQPLPPPRETDPELLTLLADRLALLTPRQREIFEMRAGAGMGFTEIGTMLDIRGDSVRDTYQRALGKLQLNGTRRYHLMSEDERATARILVDRGWTYKDIAILLGCTVAALKRGHYKKRKRDYIRKR